MFEYIELITQGVVKRVKADTIGEGEISLPVTLLKNYLATSSVTLISFKFSAGELECGSSRYSSSAIEVFPIPINTPVVLPINLNRISILRYGLNYSAEEIEKLTATVKAAKRKMKSTILESLELLEEYDVTYDDLENLVNRKIKNE
jgi:hypothetical protein